MEPTSLQLRRAAYALYSIVSVLASIFLAWKAIAYASDSPTPIVVVTSQSMEPAFRRGDILLLWNRQGFVRVGEIPVVWFEDRPLPMVHRAVETHFVQVGDEDQYSVDQYLLTKGDNNAGNDVQLYPGNQTFASRNNVIGVVRAVVPLLGWPMIRLSELMSRPRTYIA